MTRLASSFPDPTVMQRTADGINGLGEPFQYGNYNKVNHITGVTGTKGVFLVYGQSNAANFIDATYSPVNPAKIFMIDPFTNGVYQMDEPVMGCNGGLGFGSGSTVGNWTMEFADRLVTAGKYANVFIINVCAGGTNSQKWANLDASGLTHKRLLCGLHRALNFVYPLTAIIRHQGETDTTDGISAVTASNIAAERAAITAAGVSAGTPLIVNLVSYVSGFQTSADAVEAAQVAACNGTTIKEGVNANTTVGENATNRHDGLHYNATGRQLMAIAMKDWVVANL